MKIKIIILTVGLLAFSVTAQIEALSTESTAPNIIDQIGSWIASIQNILLAATTVIAAILGVWAKVQSAKASVVGPLVKVIEAHGSKELKAEIKREAEQTKVEPTLNKIVKKQAAKKP